MGLDTVELVMECEDEFQITIPDELASEIVTLGNLSDLIVHLVRAHPNSELAHQPDLEARVWKRVTALTANYSRVKEQDMTREMRIYQDLGLG